MSHSNESLAQNWRRRLASLETQLKARPEAAFAWHAHIEAKVLRFLLARYSDGRSAVDLSVSQTFISPLAVIASPKARPIKRQRMKLLRHVARENAASQALGLSSWEQLCYRFDQRAEVAIHQSRLQRRRDERMKERQQQFQQRLRNQKW
ncbi:MAG TPA: hypothetical protein VF627_07160 [Abditibacterium sp.]|jgi:hypothetical protein